MSLWKFGETGLLMPLIIYHAHTPLPSPSFRFIPYHQFYLELTSRLT